MDWKITQLQERLKVKKSSESCNYFVSTHVQEVTFSEVETKSNFHVLEPKASDTLTIQIIRDTIIFIIFWDFLMFYQIFLPPQAKRGAIITYKYGIYDCRIILSILENIRKFFFDQEKQKTLKQLQIIENDKIITWTNDFQILNYCKKFFLRPLHQNTNKCRNARKTTKPSKS